MVPAIKKRKTGDVDGDEMDSMALPEAWALMKQDGPKLFNGKEEYLEWLDETGEDVLEIVGASYYKSADMENKFAVPHEFLGFTIARGKQGEITQISDGQNNAISGQQLKKALVYSVFKEKGFRAVILGQVDDTAIEALAIPNGIQIEDASAAGEADSQKEVKIMYTYKARTTLYAPSKVVKGMLELDFVTLSEVGNLSKALNALARKEDLSDFNLSNLGDVRNIQRALADSEAKQSRKNLLQTLLASKISTMNFTDRLAHFKTNPSYTLANNLSFRLPHSGPCYTSLGNKFIAKVPLGSVGPDDSILMSTNVMSQKDYKELLGDTAQYQVYVNTEDLGGRKGSKWAKMNVKILEDGEDVKKMLSAISDANGSVGGSSEADPQGGEQVSMASITLD